MLLKDVVITEVQARTPVNKRERDAIERFLLEIDRLEDPSPNTPTSPHVTASGVIVGPRDVILHRHRILATSVAPGGHIDPGEAPWDTAHREATEETGLILDHPGGILTLVHVDVHQGPRGHTHLHLRDLFDGGDSDPNPPPDESQEVAWFRWDQAHAITEACMQGILRHLTPTT